MDCAIDRGGRTGGLVLLWDLSVDVEIKSFSSNHIDALINGGLESDPWRFTDIYGWAEDQFKWRTWNMIDTLAANNTRAWICMSDFNEILFNSEKKGGNLRRASHMNEFRDWSFFGN